MTSTQGFNPYTSFDLGRTLRTGRRRSDMSQRQLAKASGVTTATLARLEAQREPDPLLSTVVRLLAPMRIRVAALDVSSGTELIEHVSETWRDKAGRHYPAHLEPIPCVGRDDDFWWAWLKYSTWADPPAPDYTYFTNRSKRDGVRSHMDPYREWVHCGPRTSPDGPDAAA